MTGLRYNQLYTASSGVPLIRLVMNPVSSVNLHFDIGISKILTLEVFGKCWWLFYRENKYVPLCNMTLISEVQLLVVLFFEDSIEFIPLAK